MVISCSASRSITTTKDKKVTFQDSNKNLTKKLDSVPSNQLLTTEKELKKEINKTVSSSPLRTSDSYDKILESLNKQGEILIDVFNLNVSARMKNDSLEWVNRQKDTALLHREKVIDELLKQKAEDVAIGKTVLQRVESAGKLAIRVVFYFFGGIGLVMLTIYLAKKDVKNQIKNIKQGHG